MFSALGEYLYPKPRTITDIIKDSEKDIKAAKGVLNAEIRRLERPKTGQIAKKELELIKSIEKNESKAIQRTRAQNIYILHVQKEKKIKAMLRLDQILIVLQDTHSKHKLYTNASNIVTCMTLMNKAFNNEHLQRICLQFETEGMKMSNLSEIIDEDMLNMEDSCFFQEEKEEEDNSNPKAGTSFDRAIEDIIESARAAVNMGTQEKMPNPCRGSGAGESTELNEEQQDLFETRLQHLKS